MKKFLSSLAILSIVLGMTSMVMAKSFSDVKSTDYKGAVDILSDLKIVDGYTDGTYLPKKAVKRSEMAKLITVALGEADSAEFLKGSTNFKDVAGGHWASGYINLASSLGIIKGYPDGSFKPDDTVSYVEAVTMLLRALKYDKELEDLSWPTGYMTKGNSAGILEDVTANNSGEDAIRGNVALMVLNTLKGYTRKISATTNSGVQYGNGDILLEKTFDDMFYVKKGEVVDINLAEETITVEDKNNNRKVEVLYTDSTNIKKLFRREVSFIYSEDIEDFYSFETLDKMTVKVVEVSEIDKDAGLLIDKNAKEYDLPKSSNILLLGTKRYEDVEKAYITYDEKDKIVCMTLEGTEKIYVGVVTDKSVTIDGKAGIEIINPEDNYEKLVLANSSAKIYVNDVIVYTYNADGKIVIKTLQDVNDAKNIESKTSLSIKLENKSKITFSKASDYKLYLVEGDYIVEGNLSKVDVQYDRAIILEYGEITYIIVFVNSVPEEDIVTDVSVSAARKALNTSITNAKKKISKESTYSVVTIEALKDAVEYGERIYAASSSYSSARIQIATRDIETAVTNLKTATTADKELRTAFKVLTDIIAKAEEKVKEDYTTASWTPFSSALAKGKAIKIESTTKTKINEAAELIEDTMLELITNLSDSQIKESLAVLKETVTIANGKTASDYTRESYKDFEDALKVAKETLNATNVSARQIDIVNGNLEAAIKALEQINLASYKSARKDLDTAMTAANAKVENEYTATSWNAYINLLDDINADYEALKDVDDVEKLANSEIPDEKKAVESIQSALNTALGKLILKTDATARTNSINSINKCIQKFETYTEETWAATDPVNDYTTMKTLIDEAKEAVNDDSTTTEELKNIAASLTQHIIV